MQMDSIVKTRASRELPSPVFLELLEQFYGEEQFQSHGISNKLKCSSSLRDGSLINVIGPEITKPKIEVAGSSKKKENENGQGKRRLSDVQDMQFLIDDIDEWKIGEINREEISFDLKCDLKSKEREKCLDDKKKSVKFLLPFNISTLPSAQEKEKRRLTPLTPYNVTNPVKSLKSVLANDSIEGGANLTSVSVSPKDEQTMSKDKMVPNCGGTTFDFAKKAFNSYMMSEESGDNWIPGKMKSQGRFEGMASLEPVKPENIPSPSDAETNCCCFNF